MPAKSSALTQLDRIENAIVGNGQEGLLARTARIEERLNTVDELAEETKKANEDAVEKVEDDIKNAMHLINQLTINVTKLEGALATHVGTDHLSVLMKKKQFWALIIIGFISLHLIATYVPNVWDWIMILIGVPKLIVPLN